MTTLEHLYKYQHDSSSFYYIDNTRSNRNLVCLFFFVNWYVEWSIISMATITNKNNKKKYK